MDFIRQLAMTSSVVGLWTEEKFQSTSQSQTCTRKRVMVIDWWSAAILIHYSFLNPGQTITSEKYAQQIDEMYQKLHCLLPALVNGWAQFDDQLRVAQPTFQKLNDLGYKGLPHLPYSPDCLPNDYDFFKHLDSFCFSIYCY